MKKRNRIDYFLRSKLWLTYTNDVLLNYAYWSQEDPVILSNMLSNRSKCLIGITVEEFIYQMIECVYRSKLKSKTKIKLYAAFDELEQFHIDNNTSKDIV
jgi:hypothetical protein